MAGALLDNTLPNELIFKIVRVTAWSDRSVLCASCKIQHRVAATVDGCNQRNKEHHEGVKLIAKVLSQL